MNSAAVKDGQWCYMVEVDLLWVRDPIDSREP
jgi:hypothetical protein